MNRPEGDKSEVAAVVGANLLAVDMCSRWTDCQAVEYCLVSVEVMKYRNRPFIV